MKASPALTIPLALAFALSSCDKQQPATQVETKQPLAAARPQASTVVAAASSGTVTTRWKSGPNAQTDVARDSGRLKTGPNAQTDLPLKRSW